ncbi:MAG: Fe-S cluster assembly protein SufD [Polyangiaceae bacterium]
MSMTSVPYQAELEARQGRQGEPRWLRELRSDAMARFAALGFPSRKSEAWKYTRIEPIVKTRFDIASLEELGLAEDHVLDGVPDIPGTRLVVANGRFAPHLSRRSSDDVVATGIFEALDHPKLRAHFGRHAPFEAQSFTALNTALTEGGAFVFVGPGVIAREPIHLVSLEIAEDVPLFSHPRNVIVVGEGSHVTIVESYLGLRGVTFGNAVTELVVGPGATVDHYTFARTGDAAFHIGTLQVSLERGSEFSSHAVAIGGAILRSSIHVDFEGEDARCSLDGLYVASRRQHVDHRTEVDHAKPRCTSRELYKGIVDDSGRAVFNGRVIVRPNAQKTDATQKNQNLILSDRAVVDTKPQLEIFADDVKCAHGAAVGQLDEDALFYLRSRGIAANDARRILVRAFADEVLARMTLVPFRAAVEGALFP